MSLVGSKFFVFGGWSSASKKYLNDIWALDLDSCTFAPRFLNRFDHIFHQ
jgi:hypothetical protein